MFEMPQNFQTRSEEHGTRYFDTLEEAYEESFTDKTVWKISFRVGNEPVRLVRDSRIDGEFVYEPL